MIAENDLIDIINEIHQYSVILIEMRDKSLYGIYRDATDKAAYLRVPPDAHAKFSRSQLINQLTRDALPAGATKVALDEFLKELSGKKARHIWLESTSGKKTEMGFMSIRELKNFLQQDSSPRRA